MTWPTATLDELCEINVGRTPARANPAYWGAGEPWLSIADMRQGREITRTKEQITAAAAAVSRQVAPGTVLLSFKLSIGKVAKAAVPLYTNEAIAALPIKRRDLITEDFLMRALERADLSGDSNRAAMGATLNKAKLKRVTIPLPPLTEQRRIAAILDHAEALCAKRREVLHQLDALPQSIFNEMFGGLHEQVPLGKALDTAQVFTDGDWVETKDQDPGGDVRLSQLADVGDGRWLDKSSRFLTSSKAADLRCTLLQQGDILVARMPDPLGRACVFPGDERPTVTVVDVCIIRPDMRRHHATWLMAAINSPSTRNQILRMATGTTRSRVSRGNLSKVTIPNAPIEEQLEFAGRVEALEMQRVNLKISADALDSLFTSLQSRTFAGSCD